MRFYHGAIFVALSVAILLSGCTTQKILCESPNSVINNVCCLDTNNNNVCDGKEGTLPQSKELTQSESAQEKITPDIHSFATTFAGAWKDSNFAKLYELLSKDYRNTLSKEEFIWLAQRKNAALRIKDVKVFSVAGDVVEYDLVAEDPLIKNSARGVVVWEQNAHYHRPFNYFKTLAVADVCGKNTSCVVEYAQTFKKQDVCDLAGSQRIACRQSFGVKYTYEEERELCNAIPNYFERADCIQNVSIKFGRTDACWDLSEDPQLFRCLGHVAALSKNHELCWDYMKNFTFVGDKLKHAYCIYGYVDETKDYTVCKQMRHGGSILIGALEEECYKL